MARSTIITLALLMLAGFAATAADKADKKKRRQDRAPSSPPAARSDESHVKASVGVFDRIEAKSIVLRDDAGRTRAQLGIDGENVVRFTAGAGDASGTFLLSVFPDGRAALILRDDRGRNRLAMSVREDGRPVLTLSEDANVILHDDRGRNRAVLSVPNGGPPRLTLYNDRSQATTFAPEE